MVSLFLTPAPAPIPQQSIGIYSINKSSLPLLLMAHQKGALASGLLHVPVKQMRVAERENCGFTLKVIIKKKNTIQKLVKMQIASASSLASQGETSFLPVLVTLVNVSSIS